MKVAFRTDASDQIGTGHVMRCLTLADALSKRGAISRFICRAHSGNLIDLIHERGHEAIVLPPTQVAGLRPDAPPSLPHASWLGTVWQTDALQTLAAIDTTMMDWLIVDHYSLDFKWEKTLRSACKRLMVIDDLADRLHDCDLLLDQNFGSSRERYTGLVPQSCVQLHGPDHALINPAYAAHRDKFVRRIEAIRRVLIYFGGGAGSVDIVGMALRALSRQELTHIKVDIVISHAYRYRLALESAATQRGGVTIHTQLPNLVDLMAIADLSIGAGGVTTWERCCMGLPSIVVSVADNQQQACEALAAKGLIQYLGSMHSVHVDSIAKAIHYLQDHPADMARYSHLGRELVGGDGAAHVAQLLSQDIAHEAEIEQLA